MAVKRNCKIDGCGSKGTRLGSLCTPHFKEFGPNCPEKGCTTKAFQKGLCRKHYDVWMANRTPEEVAKSKSNKPCGVEDCTRTVGSTSVYGLCNRHYKRLKISGSPESAPVYTAEERFWSRVDKTEDGCWTWTGYTQMISNYESGVFYDNGAYKVHRWSYEKAYDVKLLPMEPIHHKCANSLCVRPDHLQRVSQKENMAEMLERNAYKRRIAVLEAEVARLKAAGCGCLEAA